MLHPDGMFCNETEYSTWSRADRHPHALTVIATRQADWRVSIRDVVAPVVVARGVPPDVRDSDAWRRGRCPWVPLRGDPRLFNATASPSGECSTFHLD